MKRVLLVVLALLMVLVPVTAASAEEGAAAEPAVSEELMVEEQGVEETLEPAVAEEKNVEQIVPETPIEEAESLATDDGNGDAPKAIRKAVVNSSDMAVQENYNPDRLRFDKPAEFSISRVGTTINIEVILNHCDGLYFDLWLCDEDFNIIGWIVRDQYMPYYAYVSDSKWDTSGFEPGTYILYADIKSTPGDYENDLFFDFVEVELTANATVDRKAAADFVARLYTLVLNRQPDTAGLNGWVDQLMTGQISGADAAYGFFFSDEMMKRKLSNADYVEVLYKTLMGRNADAGGKSAWLAAMGRGENREQIFAGFVNSEEFEDICAAAGIDRGSFTPNENAKDKYQVQDFVNRLYSLCLGRSADGGGLNGWTDQLMSGANTGTQAAHGFFFSAEMEGKNLSPGDYVEVLYKVMLNRNADGGGKAAWVRLLEQGQTREEIFYGFANSPEFDSICKSYGIKR
ncbi:MAG: DUF4214 domain-containing protein [Christensenellaceae bacterium]|jgi:hypothetical protein